MSGAGRGQRQRESSPGLGRRQGPRCPPAHSGLPGNWGPPPRLAQRRRRRLPAVPRAPSGENASSAARKPGREREGGSGRARGRPRGCRGLRTYLPQGPPHQANHHRHLARVLYWRPNDNTEAPQTRPGATNGGAGRP